MKAEGICDLREKPYHFNLDSGSGGGLNEGSSEDTAKSFVKELQQLT